MAYSLCKDAPFKTVKVGKTYRYKVYAVNDAGAGKASSIKNIGVLNHKKAVAIKSAKSSAKKKMTVKIKSKAVGATGYQIQYSLKKTFKGAKATTMTKTSKTITKLSSGKTYYVRVRAYNKVNGKNTYAKWSKVKTVKVK